MAPLKMLQEVCVDSLASHMEFVGSLRPLPEHLAVALFDVGVGNFMSAGW